MTKGLVRYHQAGCLHFLTFSCYRRLSYLGTSAARGLFECSLEVMRKRYDFVVCGYVVMPEHVHLLVSEPKKALPRSENPDLGHPNLVGRTCATRQTISGEFSLCLLYTSRCV